jgi:hypothetical protein
MHGVATGLGVYSWIADISNATGVGVTYDTCNPYMAVCFGGFSLSLSRSLSLSATCISVSEATAPPSTPSIDSDPLPCRAPSGCWQFHHAMGVPSSASRSSCSTARTSHRRVVAFGFALVRLVVLGGEHGGVLRAGERNDLGLPCRKHLPYLLHIYSQRGYVRRDRPLPKRHREGVWPRQRCRRHGQRDLCPGPHRVRRRRWPS